MCQKVTRLPTELPGRPAYISFIGVRPTLMGMKNLNENGPNPFAFLGPKIWSNLMATVLFWRSFDKFKLVYAGEIQK